MNEMRGAMDSSQNGSPESAVTRLAQFFDLSSRSPAPPRMGLLHVPGHSLESMRSLLEEPTHHVGIVVAKREDVIER